MAPEDGTKAGATVMANHTVSRTSSSCWWAALALVRTAPCLLGDAPACHPIGKPSVAIVRLAWCADGAADATTALVRATLAMHPTAPFFFGDTPANLPIRESILAIVRICWRWRLSGLPTDVVNPAAPLLLGPIPRDILTYCAIVWVNGSCWGRRDYRHGRRRPWRCGWRRPRRCGWRRRWPSLRRRRWRRRWRCWERSWRNRRRSLWQSCGRAAPANHLTAVVLLRLRPHSIVFHVTSKNCAVPWL